MRYHDFGGDARLPAPTENARVYPYHRPSCGETPSKEENIFRDCIQKCRGTMIRRGISLYVLCDLVVPEEGVMRSGTGLGFGT